MTATVRGPYRAGVEKRRRIVENAIRVFGERGYGGGSLRMIADAVGAPASQIIALFGSKDGLLTAVLERWDEEQVAAGDATGLAHVELLRERIRYSRDHPEWVAFFSTLCAEAASPAHPAHAFFADRYERLADGLGAQLALAARRGEIAALGEEACRREARMLSAMMDGLQLQWLMNRDLDLVALFDRHLDDAIARWRTAEKIAENTAEKTAEGKRES